MLGTPCTHTPPPTCPQAEYARDKQLVVGVQAGDDTPGGSGELACHTAWRPPPPSAPGF